MIAVRLQCCVQVGCHNPKPGTPLPTWHPPRRRAAGRSSARNEKRLQALRACVRMITTHAGGCTTPFPFEAAIWLLEELEELYGGAVPICGQARP